MRSRLRTVGIASLNVIGTAHGSESTQFWSIVRTFTAVFPSVALYVHLGRDYPDRQNFLLAGSPQAQPSFPVRAGLFDLWPAEEWPAAAGALVYRDLQWSRGGGGEEDASPLALVKGEE